MVMPKGQLGQGNAPGRKRNTMNNMSSKQNIPLIKPEGISGGNLPTLDPAATANYYGQLQTLQSQLYNTLAGLRQQRVGLRGDAKVMRQDLRQQGIGQMSESVNASLERGMLGSSSDLSSRAGIKADVVSGVTDVNRQLYDQLAENRLEGSAASLQYEQGVQGVESQAIAQRMTLQQQEEQNQLQMKIARMQAHASEISNDAQMEMALKQLRAQRQQNKALRQMANHPVNPYATPGNGRNQPGSTDGNYTRTDRRADRRLNGPGARYGPHMYR